MASERGERDDRGFRLGLFDGRFSLRYNEYVVSSSPTRLGALFAGIRAAMRNAMKDITRAMVANEAEFRAKFPSWPLQDQGDPKFAYPFASLNNGGFETMNFFNYLDPYAVTADSCNGGKSSFALADEIEADALAALATVKAMKAAPNTELRATLDNIKAMSYLTNYYAYKIRGATHLKAKNQEQARGSLGTAYCWWMKYSNLMDSMFTGMHMQRTQRLADWHAHDEAVLKEYADLGGKGTPSCATANSL